MGAALALASALCYGLADFAGGLLARRASYRAVALVSQASGILLAGIAAPLVSGTAPGVADLGWGALSGVGTGTGMLFLFRGLARGAMTVVVPVSAVGGVAIPVLVGVAALGDRPTPPAWAGIVLAVPALWLVARGAGGVQRSAAVDGLIASAGIAVQYLALAQAGPASGIWAVAAGRVTATAAVALAVPAAPGPLRLPRRYLPAAAATGGTATLALVCYLLATRSQLLVLAVVLSSLYPVLPVLLGVTVLRERLSRYQLAGLAAAAAAIALIMAA